MFEVADNYIVCDTTEEAVTWCNHRDFIGIFCATFVLLCFAFGIVTTFIFLQDGYLNYIEVTLIYILTFMALWAHLKAMLTDPGAVPRMAKPIRRNCEGPIVMCGRCNGYKPPQSHHDRISNRCICRMDHYCPWTNNAIGAGNQKHFILFLAYSNLCCIFMYIAISLRMLKCDGVLCLDFSGRSLILARTLLFVLLFGILFTSAMLVNQAYGIITGMGTIDRLKSKGQIIKNRESIPLSYVFGDHFTFAWLPIDPYFRNPDEVFQYSVIDDSIL